MTKTTATFPLHAASAAAARGMVREKLAGRPCVPLAELAASELVTNVVRHAPENAGISVSLEVGTDWVRIEVAQSEGAGSLPQLPLRGSWPAPTELDGRGLHIVDTLARHWGVERGATTTVWCEIAC